MTDMEWYAVLILVLLIPVILFPAAFVWYLSIGGIYAVIREARKRRAARKHEEGETGGLAIIGRRARSSVSAIRRAMQAALPVAILVGIYVFLIWFFLAGLGWAVALALGLAIPIMLIPVAFSAAPAPRLAPTLAGWIMRPRSSLAWRGRACGRRS